ncbi:esterase [Mesobacillus campisalis]|uniref:Putative 2-succinyl-6-hydroxy-2,4-cyclohexadiene-1-carboxylate synthase n=1 Tax=Mesobacillus campisalis TaxID=1408103 RepID=A0A0M2SUB7_9BACI|nr:2-succinyl-6-hydroxy-2,4-cyclohexadiene-1-carboxylate synthase [Mesobacillus campisalis]KKK36210.1 esterase [Mesobacillus campisalis]
MKLELNGVVYHFARSGAGFPLLLLHGFTGSGENWRPFHSYFGANSELIMPDLIGHGRTDSPPDSGRYCILKAAADIKELLDKLDIAQTDLLGYSMGGRLAITFAILYPEKVRKLVLESTSPGLRTEEERQARRKQDQQLATRILEDGLAVFVEYWEGIPLFRSQRNLPAEARANIRRQRLQNKPEGLANSLAGMGTGSQPSWWDRLGQLSCDTLILTGKLDPKFCLIGQEMAASIPHAEYRCIEEAGHAIHVEEPEKFGTIVSRFLSNEYGLNSHTIEEPPIDT